jgi:hypothetical protein
MKIPIRIISTATTLLWLFLIAFFVSAAYSIKDVSFDLGEPKIEMTSHNKMLFSLPVTVDNKGYYRLGFFNITTEIPDKEGFIVTQGSTFIPTIEKDREIRTIHNMMIDFNELLQVSQDYLFSDKELEIHEIVSMKLAEVIPVQVSTNLSMPWGAPLCNFALGEIQYMAHNKTHAKAIVPIGFENHAFFDLAGSIQIRMYNSTDAFLGEGQTTIEAPQNKPHQRRVEISIPIAGISENGYFNVDFLTPLFDFGPLVVPYG